jgi:hypothetical protein
MSRKKKPHPRSVRGFCARHDICPATFYNEVKRGNLEYTKIGARTIVTEKQEDAYLESRARRVVPEDSAA